MKTWLTTSLFVLAIGMGLSCAQSVDENRVTKILGPDFQIYQANVDAYLNKRCGTLDCHGQPGRPFRVYGRLGLRLFDADAGLVPGGADTTAQEKLLNYEAVISLQPEEMSRVVARNGENPDTLLLLRKPLALGCLSVDDDARQCHKGGRAMAYNDPGYKCVVAWLQAEVGKPLSDTGKAFCTAAGALK